MWGRVLALALPALAVAIPVLGEEWSRARINQLPDSAFAVVELTPDGTKLRHLPHHNEQGEVDIAHLHRSEERRVGKECRL